MSNKNNQDAPWVSSHPQYYSPLDNDNHFAGLDDTPSFTFTDEVYGTVGDNHSFTSGSYLDLSWQDTPDPLRGSSLLLTPDSATQPPLLPSESPSPSVSDNSYFASPHSSPYGTSNRSLPHIRVDTAFRQSHLLAPTSALSPSSYSFGHGSAGPSSDGSSGGISSIPLPTPATSPSLLTNMNIPMASISPVSSMVNMTYLPSITQSQYFAGGDFSLIDIAERESRPGDGPIIPQARYRPHTRSDQRRYVEEIDLAPPITFYNVQTGRMGIPLKDALSSKFMDLVGRDEWMFQNCGPSVSIRLNWPGYMQWSRQIPTKDFRSPPLPITRSKLAKNVAKTVQRFIEEVKDRRMEDPRKHCWRVGNRAIGVDDLILLGLEHVSKGSWQAHLRVRRPLA